MVTLDELVSADLPKPGMTRKSAYKYDAKADVYRCPQGQAPAYATTNRTGYRHYKSDPAECRACPLLGSCTGNARAERTITRHVWQDARNDGGGGVSVV